MVKILENSEMVGFPPLGDLTRNDPLLVMQIKYTYNKTTNTTDSNINIEI